MFGVVNLAEFGMSNSATGNSFNIQVTEGDKRIEGQVVWDANRHVVKHLTIRNTNISEVNSVFSDFLGDTLTIRESVITGPVVIRSASLKKLVLINTCAPAITIVAESGVEHIQVISTEKPTYHFYDLEDHTKFRFSAPLYFEKPITTLVFKSTPVIYHDHRFDKSVPVVGNLLMMYTSLRDLRFAASQFIFVLMCGSLPLSPGGLIIRPVTSSNFRLAAPSGIVRGTVFQQKPCDLNIPYTTVNKKITYSESFFWKDTIVADGDSDYHKVWLPAAFAMTDVAPELRAICEENLALGS